MISPTSSHSPLCPFHYLSLNPLILFTLCFAYFDIQHRKQSRNLYLPGARSHPFSDSNSKRFEKILKAQDQVLLSSTTGSSLEDLEKCSGSGVRGKRLDVQSASKTLERIWRELGGSERER